MPKRISKPRRKVPRLTAAQKDFFRRLDTSGGVFSLENAIKLYAGVVPLRGNITTGPERTPLGVMTPEQFEAYKKMRLEEVRKAVAAGLADRAPAGHSERKRKEQADAELRSTEHSGGRNAKEIR